MSTSRSSSLRIGFLGAGGMGRLHASRLLKLKGVNVVAICSRPMEFAVKMNDDLLAGKAACYEDFEQMLDEVPMDALYVCLPPFAHDGQVELAAKRGLHLFLEKPLSIDVRRATSMVSAIEKAKVTTQMGYHMRFGEPVRKLKKMIEDGSAGQPTLFEGSYWSNALHGPWWRDVTKSGGQILEQAIHAYDLALHFFGPVKAVSGLSANLLHKKVPGYTVEDTSSALLRFANGAMGTLSASNCAVPTQWRISFRVVCEKVTAEFTNPSEAIFWQTKGRTAEEIFKSGKPMQPQVIKAEEDLYQQEDTNFIRALQGKGAALTPARQGLESLKVCTAVLQSAKAGGKVVTL